MHIGSAPGEGVRQEAGSIRAAARLVALLSNEAASIRRAQTPIQACFQYASSLLGRAYPPVRAASSGDSADRRVRRCSARLIGRHEPPHRYACKLERAHTSYHPPLRPDRWDSDPAGAGVPAAARGRSGDLRPDPERDRLHDDLRWAAGSTGHRHAPRSEGVDAVPPPERLRDRPLEPRGVLAWLRGSSSIARS